MSKAISPGRADYKRAVKLLNAWQIKYQWQAYLRREQCWRDSAKHLDELRTLARQLPEIDDWKLSGDRTGNPGREEKITWVEVDASITFMGLFEEDEKHQRRLLDTYVLELQELFAILGRIAPDLQGRFEQVLKNGGTAEDNAGAVSAIRDELLKRRNNFG